MGYNCFMADNEKLFAVNVPLSAMTSRLRPNFLEPMQSGHILHGLSLFPNKWVLHFSRHNLTEDFFKGYWDCVLHIPYACRVLSLVLRRM